MEAGDGCRDHYPVPSFTNNFRNIQIIARKRRRPIKMSEDRAIFEEMSGNNETCSNHRCSSSSSLSSSSSPSSGSCYNNSPKSSFLFSSPLVVLLTSLFFFLCLVPHTYCLPFGDGSSMTISSSSGGNHRSQLDLLIDPIHQAEFGDEDAPLESKRIVAKSVFDMVLRTPAPPTSSSRRCPPGTRRPYEGGPCVEIRTEPIPTADRTFLLEDLIGLAEKGVLIGGPSRQKRPGKGRRRPSGRPGSRPKTTTFEPPTSSTTPYPMATDEVDEMEEPSSTISSAGESINMEGITMTQAPTPTTPAPAPMREEANNVDISYQVPIIVPQNQETTTEEESPGSTLPVEVDENETISPALLENPPPVMVVQEISKSQDIPSETTDSNANGEASETNDVVVSSTNPEPESNTVVQEVKLGEVKMTSSVPSPSERNDAPPTSVPVPLAIITATQKIASSLLSATTPSTKHENVPDEITTSNIAHDMTTDQPSSSSSSSTTATAEEKSGQIHLEATTGQQELAKSPPPEAALTAASLKDEVTLDDRGTATDVKQPESVQATLEPSTIANPESSSSIFLPTFTRKELTIDVNAKDKKEDIDPMPPMTSSSSEPVKLIGKGDAGDDDDDDDDDEQEIKKQVQSTKLTNKDDIDISTKLNPPAVQSPQREYISGTSSSPSAPIPGEEGVGPGEHAQINLMMGTRMVRLEDMKPVSVDQGEITTAPGFLPKSTLTSEMSVEEKSNQQGPGYEKGSLILDEQVTTPSSKLTKESAEESKRDDVAADDKEDKRVLILITKEGEPKRPLKPESEKVGQVSSPPQDYQIARERQVERRGEEEVLVQETTSSGDVNMTGSNLNRGEDVAADDDTGAILVSLQDHIDVKKGVTAVEGEGDDGLPFTDNSVVNHAATEKGTVTLGKEEGNDNGDLLIINNPQVSPELSPVDEEDSSVVVGKNKDGEEITYSPNFIVHEEKSSSSREDYNNEHLQDFTTLARDEPVLSEENNGNNDESKYPATTLLPPTTSPTSSAIFSKDSPTLLQFQLPIVTKGPGLNQNANGFEKFPEFPISPSESQEGSTGQQERFPTGEENLVPAEGAPTTTNANNPTFRPVLVEDFQLDFPPQTEPQQQEWQTPKPFPQQTSSPSPAPKEPVQIQTSQPEYYDTGSTEYLESELDRRHQKTRSRNRIRFPDAVTTNSPLPPELVFYPSLSHYLRRSSPSPQLPLGQSQQQQSPFQQQFGSHHRQQQQPLFFARKNPSGGIPFGYLNFRSGPGHDGFNNFNVNRRLQR